MATSSVAAIGTSFPNRSAFKTVTKHPNICSASIKSSTNAKGLILSIGNIRSCRNFDIKTRGAKIMASTTTETEKLGVKIIKNPPESKLSELGVRSWPKWGCPPSKFPWTYSSKETCFLLEGKVKVYPDGSDEAVEIGAGDLVVFPKGMSCTWDVSVAVDKHYQFE